MEIRLWAAELTRALTEEEEASLMELLPEARRERALRIRNRQRRREPLCAYLLLRYALYQALGWRDLPELATTSVGKPYFPQFPEVHFNLSHTRGAVLLGLHDQPIGVDIERIRPVAERTVRRLAGAATERGFFESWVRREARAKRIGNSAGMLLGAEPELAPGEHVYFLDTFPGYVAATATKSIQIPETVQCLSMAQLIG